MKRFPPMYKITGPDDGPYSVKIGYTTKGWFFKKTVWLRPMFIAPFPSLSDARAWCANHSREYMGEDTVQEVYGND